MSIPESSPLVFIEQSYRPKIYYLDEQTYSRALDNLVIACIDIVILHDDHLLLGKRIYHPQKDWWFVGGRLLAGETPYIAAQRHIKCTLGIDVGAESARFQHVTQFYGAWSRRAHEPITNGTHTHSNVYAIRITDHEKNTLQLNDEFAEIKWVEISNIYGANYHQLIEEIAKKLQNSSEN